MRFRILGPLEIWSGQAWSGIGAPKWRALLAALLLNPGRAVSVDRLIAELWGDEPPAKATNVVAVYVLRLRRLIGDPDGRVLVTRAPGYQIVLDPGDLDAALFTDLVAQGRQALNAGDADRASAVLTEALGLFRGQPLADVPSSELVAAETDRIEESRIAALEMRSEAEIECGRAAEVVGDLRRLTADHPLREELWALLLRALDGAGRQAEALDSYERARTVIADQLGVDPGPVLRQLHQQLLEGGALPARRKPAPAVRPAAADHAADDAGASHAAANHTGANGIHTKPDPAGPSSPSEQAAPLMPAPSQLPADIPDFTGRDRQVKHLCDLLCDVPDDSSGAVMVALVAGAGGLGKTTLAVHAAHRVRSRFPDGQLYVSLQGASDRPAASAEVLARFLRELGVDGAQIPASQDERAALYRTRLTGRRILVVLDDARDAAQVRPLLPGSASCGVIVTSRNRLPDLAGGRLIDLDVLDRDEARVLLARIVGAERLEGEPDATAQVLDACAGLPLAIRIAGARLATRSGWKIETLARRLADEHRRIDELRVGDLAVRACFQVSFGSLPAVHAASPGARGVDPARAFRLLGLWQGPSIGLPAAAALLGDPADDVAEALEVLVDAHLLQSPAAERYRFHDLLRVYAAERTEADETKQDRDAALRRIFTWYLHTAAAADRHIAPHREQVPLDRVPPGCEPQTFPDIDAALEWCEVERPNLVAATRHASQLGQDDVAWKLPVVADGFLYRRSYWADCVTTHRIALDAARRIGDRKAEAWVLNNLGMVFGDQRMEEAIGYFEQALAIRREIADRRGEAQAANNLAFTYQNLGRFEEGVGPLLHALDVQREVGHRYGEAIALSNLGEVHLGLGRVTEAVGFLQEALVVAREIDSQPVEGYALTNLGKAHLELGRAAEAIGCLKQALALHHAVGDRYGEAQDLKELARAERGLGHPAEASAALRKAQAIFLELGDYSRAAEADAELEALSIRRAGHR
ncbi:MAG: AfsR/SARP family transcriptional regulator [Micromonosporaceae bacterium]